MDERILSTIAVAVASYLVGSIPWGLMVARLTRGIDLREHGSGRTGATNTLRVLGWKMSALVAVLDVAKGAGAVLVATALVGTVEAEVVAALAAIAGHNWPLYVGFRGGRGVATSFGALMVISPWVALFCAVLFAIIILISRYVSLGSVLAAAATIVAFLVLWATSDLHLGYVAFALISAPLLIFQHRDNIDRLLSGRERKLGE